MLIFSLKNGIPDPNRSQTFFLKPTAHAARAITRRIKNSIAMIILSGGYAPLLNTIHIVKNKSFGRFLSEEHFYLLHGRSALFIKSLRK